MIYTSFASLKLLLQSVTRTSIFELHDKNDKLLLEKRAGTGSRSNALRVCVGTPFDILSVRF